MNKAIQNDWAFIIVLLVCHGLVSATTAVSTGGTVSDSSYWTSGSIGYSSAVTTTVAFAADCGSGYAKDVGTKSWSTVYGYGSPTLGNGACTGYGQAHSYWGISGLGSGNGYYWTDVEATTTLGGAGHSATTTTVCSDPAFIDGSILGTGESLDETLTHVTTDTSFGTSSYDFGCSGSYRFRINPNLNATDPEDFFADPYGTDIYAYTLSYASDGTYISVDATVATSIRDVDSTLFATLVYKDHLGNVLTETQARSNLIQQVIASLLGTSNPATFHVEINYTDDHCQFYAGGQATAVAPDSLVPEPATLSLLAIGALPLLTKRKK